MFGQNARKDEMMGYLVSIIMPTYKRGKSLLKRAVDSVLSQTYNNIELVVIDDNGGEALKSYHQEVEAFIRSYQDKRITYLWNRKNKGVSKSRNRGIEVARGTYITFLDDDDCYLPEKIEKQLEYMVAHQLQVCFSDLIYHNEKEKIVDVRTHERLKKWDQQTLLSYHLTRHITGTPTFMYQKKVLQAIGGFPEVSIGEEYYLMQRTIEKGYQIGYLHRADVIAYRHQGEGLTTGADKISGEKKLYAFKKRYFEQLSFANRQFIHFRHYMIMAIIYKRKQQWLKTFLYTVYAFLHSPVDAFYESGMMLYRIRKYARR